MMQGSSVSPAKPLKTIAESSYGIQAMTNSIVERLERLEDAIRGSSPKVARQNQDVPTLTTVLENSYNNCEMAFSKLESIEIALGLKGIEGVGRV